MRARASHLLLALLLAGGMLVAQARQVEAQTTGNTTAGGGIVGAITSWWQANFGAQEAIEAKINSGNSAINSLGKHSTSIFSNLQVDLNLAAGGLAAIPEESLPPEGSVQRKQMEEALGYGMIGDLNKGIVAMYNNRPAQTATFVADIMNSAKIVPSAQAQGLGFAALDPILNTWKIFRNLAYLFFVIAFIVIGFMIMFRVQMGKAAITVQQALPNIIIALLAVTFSYAVAGLMIDLMYVIMFMLASFFPEGRELVSGNIWTLVGAMFNWGEGGTGAQKAVEKFMENSFIANPLIGTALKWLSGLAAATIIGLAILFATFKIFFELIKTYIAVILSIVFAPITLMMGAFSGSEVFVKWIKSLTGHLVMWPVVLICILINRTLTAPARATGFFETGEFIGGFLPPFLWGQGQGEVIPVFIGVGILLVIPEIMQQVKKAMGVDEGIFPQLAKDAWSRIQSVPQKTKSAATTAIPLGYSVARGLPEMRRAGQDYDAVAGEQGNIVDKLRVMTVGGHINPKDPNSPKISGYLQGAGRGFKEGQRKNEDVQNVLSGKFLTQNTAEELARRQLEDLENKDGGKTSTPPSPAQGNKSTT